MTRKKRKGLLSIIQLQSYSDGLITAMMFALMIFGTVMIVSTDVGETTSDSLAVVKSLGKQMAYLGVGYICMVFASKYYQFRAFSRWRKVLFPFMIGLMIAPFFFAESGGSHAWIRLPGGFSIQPAEFVKPFMVLMVANACYRVKKNRKMTQSAKEFYHTPFIAMGIFLLLLLAQKDLGTLVIILVTFYACIMIPSYPSLKHAQKWFKIVTLALVLLGVGLFGITDIGTSIVAQTPFSHVATRVENFKNPYQDIYGEGYQPANALYGIANSGIFGKGLGNSSRKYGYLTQADNDYILAIVIEETGVFGLGLISFCYLVLLGRLFYYAFKTNEICYKVVLGGIGTYIFMHFFLNVGGVSCLIPFTGVPLLLISSGGSSVVGVCMSIGICQSCISHIRKREMKR